MPVSVRCSNPLCSVAFAVDEADARRLDACPACKSKLVFADGSDPDATNAYVGPVDFPSTEPAIVSTMRFAPGMLLDGRYEITRLLGEGGMGCVYLAVDRKLKRQVAIKVPTALHNTEALKRFAFEAEVAAKLEHPNIGHINNVGEFHGFPYIDIAYVDGISLANYLAARGKPFELDQAAKLVRVVAAAIHEAHSKGIIHRDLKPANIMIRRDGRPIVMDFGLAKAVGGSGERITVTGRALGTPAYMPIEQFDPSAFPGGPDHRCDIYSLGIILYELITGKRPFDGELMALVKVSLYEFDPPMKLRPDLDPVLQGICLKAMAQYPDQRYATMKEFFTAVDAWLKTAPAARAVAASSNPQPKKPKAATVPVAPTPTPAKRTVPERIVVGATNTTLTLIRRGSFLMGSNEVEDELPVQKVTISRAFYLGVYPVTQVEYESLVGVNPSNFQGEDRRPVENVSWFDAVAFCNALSEADGISGFYAIDDEDVTVPDWRGTGYRLPTEAEWEYACRAGSTTKYWFGDDDSQLGSHAWFNGNAGGKTHAVGGKKANRFGLHDMIGNVWQWCWDEYDASYDSITSEIDPRGPTSGAFERVLRGGSWSSRSQGCRSSGRGKNAPTLRGSILGFRIAAFRTGI